MFNIGDEEENEAFFDLVKDVAEQYGGSGVPVDVHAPRRTAEQTVRTGTHRVRPPCPISSSEGSGEEVLGSNGIGDSGSSRDTADDENIRRVDGCDEWGGEGISMGLDTDEGIGPVESTETVLNSSGTGSTSQSNSSHESGTTNGDSRRPTASSEEDVDLPRLMSGFEEVGNDGIMSSNDCTRLLASRCTASGVYNAVEGAVDDNVASEIGVDLFFLPVREDGVFKEGKKKTRAAKELVIHPREMLSHAYLRTSEDGVLHVLPGWDHKTFMIEYSYRFHASHTQQRVQVPFLSNVLCNVRTFNCLGVYVCPKCPVQLRKSCHVDVDEEDKNILDSLDDEEDENGAKKRIQGVYRDIRTRHRFCTAMRVGPAGTVGVCVGHAVVKQSHNPASRNNFLLGCSEYKKDEKGHYARSLPYPDEYVEYLKRLLSGEDTIPSIEWGGHHPARKHFLHACEGEAKTKDLPTAWR